MEAHLKASFFSQQRTTRGEYGFEYVAKAAAAVCAGGVLSGLVMGGLIRGRKPLQYAAWTGLNSLIGSVSFFAGQEFVAMSRSRDDALNSALGGFFSGCALGLRNSPASAPKLATGAGLAGLAAHAALMHHRYLDIVRENLSKQRLSYGDDDEDGDGELSAAATPSATPKWLPIRKISDQEFEEMKSRASLCQKIDDAFREEEAAAAEAASNCDFSSRPSSFSSPSSSSSSTSTS